MRFFKMKKKQHYHRLKHMMQNLFACQFVFALCIFLAFYIVAYHRPYSSLYSVLHSIDGVIWSNFELGILSLEPPGAIQIDKRILKPRAATVVDNDEELCPFDPPEKVMPAVSDHGRFHPANCRSRHRVAIIVPFRDRASHLATFLSRMHPIWQRQQLDYRVYIINQAAGELFNRGKLMNVGFAEAVRDADYDCFVFHDVDLLAESETCSFKCPEADGGRPRHLSSHIDKFNYNDKYYSLGLCSPAPLRLFTIKVFGGASVFSRDQFVKVNGFSNYYWGWGGEDDDLYLRTWQSGYEIESPTRSQCSYQMIPHNHESSNKENPIRYILLKQSLFRKGKDGLNSLGYRVLTKEENPKYTNVTVDIGKPSTFFFSMIQDVVGEKQTRAVSCIESLMWMLRNLPSDSHRSTLPSSTGFNKARK